VPSLAAALVRLSEHAGRIAGLETINWLSELWSVLYLRPSHTAGILVGQAEWQTRLLSAAADQMARDRSSHRRMRLSLEDEVD
jgi:hypothetical protein